MSNRYVVIMAGGRGERFWPQSRLSRPKHLLPIVGENPMLAQTVERLEGLVPPENIFIITNRQQREAVIEVVSGLPSANIIAEPVGRDTAAAVGLAMILVRKRDPEAVFAMLPADHVIRDLHGFQNVLTKAFALAGRREALVTIGVNPTEPATGYGYIQRGREMEPVEGGNAFEVKRFVEKPDRKTAETYIASGEYFWNAGMFVWRAGVIDTALARYVPELHKGLREIENALNREESLDTVLDKFYPGLLKTSIDYAVMEKASNVAMLESAFDWDDVGSWPAVARHFPADAEGNVIQGEVLLEKASNNIVRGEKGRVIAAVGVDNLIIIQTADATLVCRRDQAQDIKQIVQRLGENPAWEHLL